IYFIADGINYIPYEDLYASYYGLSPILPDNGCLVAFSLDNDGHGTGCSGTAAGQGRIPFAGADGNVYYLGKGMAPDAKIINVPIFNVWSDTFDAWFFAVEGYDGDPTTPEDGAQICSNSFGYSSAYDDGWNTIDRYLYYIAAMYGGGVTTFTIANGNGGPGYGTITTPTNPFVVNVGAATEMGYRIPYGYEGGTGGAKYGDIIPFSGRGPTAMGYHGPDVVAVGAYGWAAIPLWQIFDGSMAGDLFGGTSQACPAAAGALALIYDAYKQRTGYFPSATVAKRLLMLGADDIHYDVYAQGSGYINCKRSADMARGWSGIYSTLSYWQPGTSTGLPGGSKPVMFAKMMFPGTSDSTTFVVYNYYNTAKVVNLAAKEIVKIGEATTTLTTNATTNRWYLKLSDLITDSNLRNSTQLLRVTAYLDYTTFDMKTDYTPDVIYRVDIHDWTDANGNGIMDNATSNQEFNRYTVELVTGNVQEVWIHDPVARSHTDTVIEVRPYRYSYTTHGPITIHLRLESYAQQDWPLIAFSASTLNLNASGAPGYSASVTATITVPADYGVGCYEGAILINDGTNTSVIPVSLNVAGNFTNDSFVFGTNTLNTVYENSKVRGKYDWGWRAETGDWRFYFIWVNTSLTDLSNQYLLLDLNWQYVPTDIDAYIQGPKLDVFSAYFPSTYGPYTLSTIGRSSNSYVSAGKYTFDSSTDDARDIVFAPLKPGLNQIILHNTLLNATSYPENFTWELSRMYYKSWTTDLYAYVTDHVYTTGKVGEVAINSSKDWDGFSSKVESMTATLYTNQIVYQDNPDDYTTASWIKPVKVLGASMLKIAITRVGNPSDDLDLFLVYDANNNGQYDPSGDALKAYSATAAALEAITYKNPADGTYFVLVHGWSVPGGQDNFDIYIGIGSKMPLFSCVGLPTFVHKDTLYTFDIMANIPPIGGVFGASVGFGPENSGKTFLLDVQAEIEDGAPPELQVSSPADGSYVTTPTPLIKARYTDDVVTSPMDASSVVVKVDGITVTAQARIDPDSGEISFKPLSALPEGTHTVYISAKDSYGNGASITWSFTIDTIPPTLVVTAPTGGEITNNPTLKVKGYTDPVDSTVTVNGNTVPLAADGSFDYPVALSEGSNTITVIATDVAGHTVKVEKKVTLDTKAPTLTVTEPAEGDIVTTTVITVKGTTEKNAVVMVNGNYATVDSTGKFSADVTLAEGTNVIQVTARDAAGNIAKATVNVILDTIAPVLAVTSPADGTILATNSVTVSGTVSDANLETLKVNGNVVPVTNNAFTTEIALSEGTNTITVVATDLAGHTTTVTLNVVADTLAPTLSVTASATDTKVPVVTISGTATDTGTGVAKVTVNGNLVTVDSTGRFTANVGLLEGTNTITVIAYDLAGNSRTETLSVNYTYVPELGDLNNRINDTNNRLNNTNSKLDDTKNQLDTTKNDLNNRIDDTKKSLSDQINSTGLNAMLLAVLGIILAIVAIVLQFVMRPKQPTPEAPKEWTGPAEETPSEPVAETPQAESAEEPKP
ncbi:MAG: Ig-like domain-containing protein, partial [Thermoplasmata archaeon]